MTASYNGDLNHSGSSSRAVAFSITQASSSTIVTDAGGIYTGSAFPASAEATGAGGLDDANAGDFTFDYTNADTAADLGAIAPINVGNYSVTATYNGDLNHSGSSSLAVAFSITQASSSTTVIDASGVYTGSAFSANAEAIGAGGLDDTDAGDFTFDYANADTAADLGAIAPTDVGNYTVTATYAGDLNHSGSTSSAVAFSITQATTSTTVSDAGGVYTGSAFPASAEVTGAGGLDDSNAGDFTFDYTNTDTNTDLGVTAPINVGNYSVTATYAGDLNHSGSTSITVAFSITQATSSTTVSDAGGVYTGSAFPASAEATGVGGLDDTNPGDFTFDYTNMDTNTDLGAVAPINVGNYTVTATYAGDVNHSGSTSLAVAFSITQASSSTTITDAGGVYTGSAFPASAEAKGAGGLDDTNPSDFTFDYKNADTTADLGALAPTDVGDYTVTATYVGDLNHSGSTSLAVAFSITQASSSTTVIDAGGVYTGSAYPASAEATGAGGLDDTNPGDFTFDYTNADTAADLGAIAPTDVGNYTVTATYNGDLNHSGSTSSTVAFSITVAAPTVTALDAGGVFTSNAFPSSSTVTGVGDDGTIDTSPDAAITFTYYIGTGTGGANLGNTAPKDVGTYTVVAHYSGSSNYSSADSSPVTFSITVATPTVTALDLGGVYTSNPFPASATVTGVGDDGTIDTSPDATITFSYYVGTGTGGANLGASAPEDVGTYTVVAHYSGSSNYSSADSSPVVFNITVATPTVTAVDAGGVYTSNAFPASATVTGVGSDGTIASSPNAAITFTYYVGTGTGGASLGASAPKNVGTYTVVAHFSGSSNYSPADSIPVTFSITVVTPTVTAVDAGGVYSSNTFPASASVTGVGSDGTIASSPNAAITFTYYVGAGTGGTNLGASAPMNVGTYTVVAHYSGSSNYSSTDSIPVTFSITVATSTVTALDAGGVYTSNAFPASASVTGVGSDGTIATSPNAAITFTYYVGSGTGGTNLGASAPKNVGTYTVVAHYSGSSNYSSADSSPVTFSITVATPTVTALDAGGVYTSNAFPASATVLGVGSDGTIASSPNAAITFTYYVGAGTGGTNLGATAPKNVGTYTVVAHFSGSSNYSSANSNPVTFSITVATPTVTALDAGGVYTSNKFPASATVTGVGSDGTIASSPNAAITFTYYVGAGTGGTNLGATAPKNVGTYTVVAHYSGSSNYSSADSSPVTFSITVATPTVTAFDAGGVYTSNAFSASATVTGVGSDGTIASSPNSAITFTYYVGAGTGGTNLGASAPKNVGTYTVVAHYSGSSNYSSANSSPVTFNITKAALTVTANNLFKAPNKPNPTLTYVIAGFVPGETLGTSGVTGAPSLSTTAVTTSPPGVYPITVTLGTLAATNYSFTLVNGTLTVDGTPPTSSVNPLPAYETSTTFNVSWTGTDNTGGSGIAFFDVYVSDNGGPFTKFVSASTGTSTSFTGVALHTYGFYSIATDNVGNVQATPTSAQATTRIAGTDTWSGASTTSANWTDPNNWVGGIAPGTDDTLVFPSTAAQKSDVDNFASGMLFNAINFTGGGYSISGNSIMLATGLNNSGSTANTFNPNIALTAAQTWSNTGSTFNVGGNVTNQGFLLTISTASSTVLTGSIQGSGGLTTGGAGTLTLSGSASNTYSGTTTVNAGALNLSKSNPATAIAGPLVIGDGVGGLNVDVVNIIFDNQIADTAPITINSSGQLNFGTSSDTIGDLTLNGGSVNVSGVSGAISLAGNITANQSSSITQRLNLVGALTTHTVTVASGATLTLTGQISGTGIGLTKAGLGTLTLNGSTENLYTGTTTVNAGTLNLSKTSGAIAVAGPLVVGDGVDVATVNYTGSNQVGDAQPITVNANGAVNMQGFSDEVGGLNFSGGTLAIGAGGTLTINGDITATAGASSITGGTLYIKEVSRNVSVASGATLTIGAGITSIFGAGINKTGTGTLVLTGANTYTGATAVNAGTLKLATGSLAGPVSVAAGATLTGSGATGALTFASSSAFTANIASSGGNQVNATGDVNLNGATLNIALGALPAAGQTFTILTSTTKIVGTFAGFANNQLVMTGGHLYKVTYNLTSVVLTFVS